MVAKGKYETHVKPKLVLVQAWARDGLTMEQIAHNLGISKQTLNEYRKLYPDFSDAIINGREVIDAMVENALLKAAMGYVFSEETVTNQGKVVEVRKYEKPNTTALIFWLKNRKPANWRDKREVEHGGTISLADVLLRADELEDEHEKTVH